MEVHSFIQISNSIFGHVWLNAQPQGLTILVVALVVFLLLVFTISGAEVAFFSLNEKDINMLKTKQNAAARRIIQLLEEPKALYTSLLISGTFLSICIIVLSNFLINELGIFPQPEPAWVVLIKVAVIALVLIFVGKILPKVWATQNNLRFAYGAAFIIEALHLLLRRISLWLLSLADGIGGKLGADKAPEISMQEMDDAIDLETNESISTQEKNILKGVVKFGNIVVKQIMRSRMDVHGIEIGTPFNNLVQKVTDLHYSRLPVYKGNLDEVVGIINTKDLVPFLDMEPDFQWQTLMRPPLFVPEQKLIEDLLIEFQHKRVHFAVVVDEFGGTSGIVTMEDILEEVIGDIKDEFDEEETVNKKLDDSNYIFDGKIMIHNMCKMMKLPVSTFDKVRGESDTLGGLVLELAGDIPPVDTVVPVGDFEFTVLQTDNKRVQQVKVAIKPRMEQ